MNKFKLKINFKGQQNCCPLLFLVIILSFFSACSKKQQTSKQEVNSTTQITSMPENVKRSHFKSFLNQAKECDISTPVGCKLIKFDSKTPDLLFFIYQGTNTLETAIKFYSQELELLGWDFKNLSTKQEGLFVANKTSKMSIISIRPQEIDGLKIFITIATEKIQENSHQFENINKN